MSYNQNNNSNYENRITVNNGCGGNGSSGGTTGGATEAKQDAQILLTTNTNTKLDLVAKDGTDITGAVLPAGGTGIRGYLSAMWEWIKARMPNLGQATMNASTPVVIANDQSDVPVSLSELPNFINPQSVSTRASQALSTITVNNGAIQAIATTDSRTSGGIPYVTFQITGTFVASFLIETSEDGVNFVTNGVSFNIGTSARITSNITTAGVYTFQVMARYFRVRTAAFTSGAAVVTSQISYTSLDGLIALGGNTIASISGTPTVTTGSNSVTQITAAAGGGNTINATRLTGSSGRPTAVFKSGAGVILSLNAMSGSGSTTYIKFYDKSTAPIAGDVPIWIITLTVGIPSRDIVFTVPLRFNAGLSAIATNDPTDANATDITGFVAGRV